MNDKQPEVKTGAPVAETVTPSTPQTPPSVPHSEPAPKVAETVTITKEHLDTILSKLDKMSADYRVMENKLNATVDRQKLDAFNTKNSKKVLPTCKISIFNGKVVLGWTDMITNKSEIYNGKEITDQRTALLLRVPLGDGKYDMEKLEVDYVTSFQSRTKEECDILSKTVDNNGAVYYKLQRADGEEITMDERFIN